MITSHFHLSQWTLYQGKIQDKNGRNVIPKSELFKILTDAHSAIAHRGRDKTDHYVRGHYSGINQEVTELFVSLCTLHQSQRSVTSYMKKPVIKPIAADSFLKHVQIDLTDFRNLPCSCTSSHKWVLHINDHYSKYSWLIPLKSKTCEEVVQALQNVFLMFGLPHTLHSDNGKEFTGKKNERLLRDKFHYTSSWCSKNAHYTGAGRARQSYFQRKLK